MWLLGKIAYVAYIVFLWDSSGLYSNSIEATFQTESLDDSILDKLPETQSSIE